MSKDAINIQNRIASDPDKMPYTNKMQTRKLEAIGLKGNGLTIEQIAEKMGITPGSARVYISKGRAQAISNDPVIRQRYRLQKRLKQSDEVIGKALQRALDDPKYNETGARVAIELNKGLGVLRDKIEVDNRLSVYAQLRQDATLSVEMLKAFHVEPAEIVSIEDTHKNSAEPPALEAQGGPTFEFADPE